MTESKASGNRGLSSMQAQGLRPPADLSSTALET